MNKILAFIIGLTKVGEKIKQIQKWFNGKKQIIASLAMIFPAAFLIIKNFTEQGTAYLLQIASTPEFIAFTGGFVSLFNALKGEKIRSENAVIMDKLEVPKPQ